jgi:hypothetical protein
VRLVYEGGEGLKGFSDADWANDAGDRSSVTGYVFTLGGGPVSWQSRKQATIARSSTEAEYMALGETGKEASWFKGLFKELGIRMDGPVPIGGANQDTEVLQLYGDNQGANALARNPLHHPRTAPPAHEIYRRHLPLDTTARRARPLQNHLRVDRPEASRRPDKIPRCASTPSIRRSVASRRAAMKQRSRGSVEGVAAPAAAGRSAGTWARRQRLAPAQRPSGRRASESAGLFPFSLFAPSS